MKRLFKELAEWIFTFMVICGTVAYWSATNDAHLGLRIAVYLLAVGVLYFAVIRALDY